MLARIIDYSLGSSLRCPFPRCAEPAEAQLPSAVTSRLWSSLSSGLDRSLGLLAGDY